MEYFGLVVTCSNIQGPKGNAFSLKMKGDEHHVVTF